MSMVTDSHPVRGIDLLLFFFPRNFEFGHIFDEVADPAYLVVDLIYQAFAAYDINRT
jgi:hypothetical protein